MAVFGRQVRGGEAGRTETSGTRRRLLGAERGVAEVRGKGDWPIKRGEGQESLLAMRQKRLRSGEGRL